MVGGFGSCMATASNHHRTVELALNGYKAGHLATPNR